MAHSGPRQGETCPPSPGIKHPLHPKLRGNREVQRPPLRLAHSIRGERFQCHIAPVVGKEKVG
jgi:hypothetical protein